MAVIDVVKNKQPDKVETPEMSEREMHLLRALLHLLLYVGAKPEASKLGGLVFTSKMNPVHPMPINMPIG